MFLQVANPITVFPFKFSNVHDGTVLPRRPPFTIHVLICENVGVGSVYNFSALFQAQQAGQKAVNCQRQEEDNALSTGQVPIAIALLQHIKDETKELSSLEPEEVGPY